jgi:hypothetical protein
MNRPQFVFVGPETHTVPDPIDVKVIGPEPVNESIDPYMQQPDVVIVIV